MARTKFPSKLVVDNPCGHLQAVTQNMANPGGECACHLPEEYDCRSTSACDTCSWEDHSWARVARTLLQRLPLPRDVFEYLGGEQGVVVPVGCKGNIFADESMAPAAFVKFAELPAELRRHIWKLAVVSRVVEVPPTRANSVLSCPRSLPAPANVCREAREAVLELGRSCAMAASVEHPREIWLSMDDILHIPGIEQDRLYTPNGLTLRSFRHLALGFQDIQTLADGIYEGEYHVATLTKCLRERKASSLRSLVVIINENQLTLARDQRVSELISDQDECRPLFDLIMLDDADRLQALMSLFARPDNPCPRYVVNRRMPYGTTGDFLQIWQPGSARTRNCLDCARRVWEEHYLPRVQSAWLRVMADEAQVRDQDIFPPNSDFNPQNTWIKETLGSMPEIRPAVSLRIGWDCVS